MSNPERLRKRRVAKLKRRQAKCDHVWAEITFSFGSWLSCLECGKRTDLL